MFLDFAAKRLPGAGLCLGKKMRETINIATSP
jgi:hypothetical protein